MSKMLALLRKASHTSGHYREIELFDMDRNPIDVGGGSAPSGGGEEAKITTAVLTTDTETYSAGSEHAIQFDSNLPYHPDIDLGAGVSTTSPTVTTPERALYFLRARFGFWENPYAKGSKREIRLKNVTSGDWIDGVSSLPVTNDTGVGQTVLEFGCHCELQGGQAISLFCFHDDTVSYSGNLSPWQGPDGYFAKLEMVRVRSIPTPS